MIKHANYVFQLLLNRTGSTQVEILNWFLFSFFFFFLGIIRVDTYFFPCAMRNQGSWKQSDAKAISGDQLPNVRKVVNLFTVFVVLEQYRCS